MSEETYSDLDMMAEGEAHDMEISELRSYIYRLEARLRSALYLEYAAEDQINNRFYNGGPTQQEYVETEMNKLRGEE